MGELKITAMTSDWPSFFPSDIKLPPADSNEAIGEYYRLVGNRPPTRDCFQSTHEEQPNRHKKCRTLTAKQNVYGCSMFNNANQAIDTREKFPEMLGEKLVSIGELIPDDGKIKQTFSPGHYTVWLRVNADPENRFAVVPQESK